MKTVLKVVVAIIFLLVAFGIYTNINSEGEGEKFIGIGVLVFAFILMPLFIYNRYNGKDLSRYSIDNMFKKLEENKHKKRRE
ncbi:MAG: hypothetical protein KAH67_01755 [Flavobacteriaceae bacterium]|nr:hypothetical protein [Flavobacteriaceae bacterium]